MIESSLAAERVVAVPSTGTLAAASAQPAVQAFGRRPLQHRGEGRLDPAEHLTEAERHCGREEQADRPQQQQRQAAGAAADEPAVAQHLPAIDAAAGMEQRAQAQRRARRRRVEQQVDDRRGAQGQLVLQDLEERTTAPSRGQCEPGRLRRQQPAAEQGDEQQESERQVAEQVGDEVEPGPAARVHDQEVERTDPRYPPAGERVQARVDDQAP
jgi:hypothetical protein